MPSGEAEQPPRVPATVEEVLAKLRDELDRGAYIRAYDTAERARRHGLDHPLIRYRRVLALARSGATETAAKEYAEHDLARQGDTDSRALWARILKDRALVATKVERQDFLRKAAAAYRAILDETGHYFPGINAATLQLLADDRDEARALASRLLDDPELRGASGYWGAATRAEARLILGDAEGATRELREARGHAGANWGDLSTTRRQLRRLLEAAPVQGLPVDALLGILRPPRVAHLAIGAESGDGAALKAELTELFRANEVGIATLALWSDASVAAAEAALANGIELSLVLAYEADAYLTDLAARMSPAEAARRRACVLGARSVIAVTADGDHVDRTLLHYAAVVAKGLSRTKARFLSTDWIDLPKEHAATPKLREAPPEAVAGGPPVRELRALLFADAKGFSRLPESDLPAFWSRFMAEMAAELDRVGDAVLHRNSWGDAVFCVTATIEAAAAIALAMQARAAELRREDPRSPVLRIGLHHGPVFRGWDPVRGTAGYFGTQVSRAARVEPIVPPGDVYVTEPFAAVLAAMGGGGFETEYVGVLPLHKDYGEHRMYRLARRLG